MADASVSLDLNAQELYQELQNVQSHFAQFAQRAGVEGDKAATALAHPFSGVGGKIQGALGGLSGLLGPLAGLFTVAGIEQAIQGTIQYGTKVEDLSRRFGVASETIQKFGNAAELNGSSLEAVARGFRFLEVNQAKAIGGNQGMVSAFKELGVSLEDLKSLRPEELVEKIGHSSLNAADFVKIFGKSALELRPTIAGIADGTIQLGTAISDLDTERLKQLDDFFKLISQSARVLTATVVAELLPAIGKLQDIAQAPAEAITRAFDKTPTGAAASPEDSALAAQIHAAREAAAGRPLPPELAPQGASAAAPRRDFGAAPEGGEAGEFDDQGRPIKKGTENLRERVASEERERELEGLSNTEKLARLKKEAAELEKSASNEAVYDEKERLELKDQYYKTLKEIEGTEKDIGSEAEKAEREKDKAAKDAERDRKRDAQDALREKETAEKRAVHDLERALNPAGLSLEDIAKNPLIGVDSKPIAQQALREEEQAKRSQLQGNLSDAAEHHNRAEELKKSLGLPNDIDKEKHFQDALDKSETLKAIRDNTKDMAANK